MRLADTRGRDQRYAHTAEELGRMTDEQLREIRHCALCLESYERCGCRLNAQRRREAEETQTETLRVTQAELDAHMAKKDAAYNTGKEQDS